MRKAKVQPSEELKEIIEDPLDDLEIRHYLPDAKIITYNELSRYRSINQLLPGETDYVIILYQDSPNQGHWVCLSRYPKGKNDTIEMFDPYGSKPDSQLDWVNMQQRQKLGQGRKLLTPLLDCCTQKVVYNPIKYQKESPEINNCGRHCVYRILCMLKGMDLEQYYKHVMELIKQTGLDADGVISSQIDIV
jgi:hypothetical protein